MGFSATYDIVSNAETVIVLKNPCTVFAEWDESALPSVSDVPEAYLPSVSDVPEATNEPRVRKLSKKKQRKSEKEMARRSRLNVSPGSVASDARLTPTETSQADDHRPSSAAASPIETSAVIEPDAFDAGPSGTQTETMTEIVDPRDSSCSDSASSPVLSDTPEIEATPEPTVDSEEEEVIRFHVCAGNLMSASPWFNRALGQNGWMESSRNPEDNCHHIPAQGWDENAFVVLMNVFHLRNFKVPRIVSLEMLAKIAVIADYYECAESVDLMVDVWLTDLKVKSPIPTTYCRDLMLWILISCTFKLSDVFEKATAVAIRQSNEPVRNLGLPIPAWVTEGIDRKREEAMEYIVPALSELVDFYRSATYTCPMGSSYSFRCGSMLFGTLTKSMDSLHLERAYLGQSLDDLCVRARLIESEAWFHDRRSVHSCNVSTAVHRIVDTAVASVVALSLRE